ncbi:MAG TPA: GNAT family N-acetyltransferase [Saprospiraceae bacterium]|nr:GNAT family N-acetyltransferase [Saprospiraceae bacterium]
MVNIVKADLHDIEKIQTIARITWPVTFKQILSQEQLEYMLQMMYSTESLREQMEAKTHQFLIAKQDENALGFASYELNYLNEPKTKIHKIYILPAQQGKGLGKLLFDEIEKTAIENKQLILSLNVNRENKAIEFYQHRGYKVIRQEDISIGNGYWMEDYVMEKTIGLNL